MHRRHVLGRLALAPSAFWARESSGQSAGPLLEPASLAVPGPRNSVSLPLELAQQLRLDREAGLPLRLSFVGGGGVAIQELRARNVEFAVFGLPAMVRANLTGGARMVALAAVDDLPLYTLVVRSDLRGSVRSLRDLAGRTLGVHSNSLLVRTTSHQLAEYLLRREGVDMDSVKVLAAGQSWETQSSMFISRSIDASMCDEPFATRLEAEGLAFKLFSTGNPADAASAPGSGFLRAVLVALKERADVAPERAERAVRLVQRVLAWIHGHSDEQFVDALGMQGAERSSTLAVARAYPRQYSPDGRFSARQLAETEAFFRASNDDLPQLATLRLDAMVLDRWAGRKP
jgi:NitT/TauT family transport system substrate-binding protein